MTHELAVLDTILDAAAALVRQSWEDPLEVHWKEDGGSLVTSLDLAVQDLVFARLTQEFPGDQLCSEEIQSWPQAGFTGRAWILDPIDGTQNLARSPVAPYAVSLAFLAGGQVRAGGVVFPVDGLKLLATSEGLFHSSHLRFCGRVSSQTRLDRSRLGLELHRPQVRATWLPAVAPLLDTVHSVRALGSAVAGLVEVATGGAEGYLAARLFPWDWAAAALLVEAAGGRVTRPDGSPADPLDPRPGGLLASNGVLHTTIETMLADIHPPFPDCTSDLHLAPHHLPRHPTVAVCPEPGEPDLPAKGSEPPPGPPERGQSLLQEHP